MKYRFLHSQQNWYAVYFLQYISNLSIPSANGKNCTVSSVRTRDLLYENVQRCLTSRQLVFITYLYVGGGAPWAKQNKSTVWPTRTSNSAADVCSILGAKFSCGSETSKINLYSTQYTTRRDNIYWFSLKCQAFHLSLANHSKIVICTGCSVQRLNNFPGN